jgi:hypothetical protein
MDNIQFNQLNMFRTVSKHAANAQVITDTILAFKNGITALNVKITAIQTTSGEADLALTGVTTNKNQLQEALVQSTFSVISPVKAYALLLDPPDTTLEAQMDLSVTDLRRLNDDQIGQDAQTLLGIVNPLVAELDDVGITPAIIASWQADITNYLAALANPRIAITHRASLTGELVTLFEEANKIVKKVLDPISISFKSANPHYYSDYQKAREIIDRGKGTTHVKGICTGPDGEPIFNVTVKINEQDIETTTDVDGLYILTPQLTATITITLTASGDGLESQTTPPFEVKKGESIIKNFVMLPSS